jgi:hypothetical protein
VGNESVISLNISTIEGVARNRISQTGILELRNLLKVNQFLEDLDLSSVGLGNAGLEAICDALVDNNPKPTSPPQSAGATGGFTHNRV